MHLGFLTILLVVSMQTSTASSFGTIDKNIFEFHDPSNSLNFKEAKEGLSKVGINGKSKVKNGRCGMRMEVDVDEYYRVEYPAIKKCSMKFEAKPGVTITVFCPNIKLGLCNSEYLFVTDASNTNVFCGSKNPQKAENLSEVYIQYERTTTRKVLNSVLRCYVSGSEKSLAENRIMFTGGGVKGWQICRFSCGRPKQKFSSKFRIMGGHSAIKGQHPWIVHLTIRYKSGGDALCSGTILNSRTILTAAHCVSNETIRVVFAMIGAHDLNNRNDITQVLPIRTWVIHPSFDHKRYIHDIALLKTYSSIRFHSNAVPMCLDSGANYMDRMATAVGWGYVNAISKTKDPVLQEVKLRVWDQEKCRENGGRKIIYGQLCANELGKDACKGDSGGPLTVKDDWYTYQIGIVSYGDKCGSAKYPGVYTRVSMYKTWIKYNFQYGACK